MTTPEIRLAVLSANLNSRVGSDDRLSFVDFAALLAPIRSASPTGDWLRYEPVFDTLRELRREEDASTPQGIWARDLKRTDLKAVQTLAVDLLAHRTKDLQIAAWLLEAWIRIHGFAGARIGFALVLGLCDQYWDDLHPLPDGDDFGARISAVEWINERLPARLLEVPVCRPTDLDARVFSWGDRAEALRRETLARRLGKGAKPQPQKSGDEWLTTAKFAASAGSTPQTFFAEVESDLAASIASARTLQQLLDSRCGSAAPSLSRITEVMTEIRRYAVTVLDERGHPATSGAHASTSDANVLDAPPSVASPSSILENVMEQTSNAAPVVPPAPAPTTSPTDNVAARTEAYRKLAEAADTLMRIEPHSPTPYLVRRAIAWGGMSLAELMRHFIDSGYDLKSLYSMLGMGE